MVKERKNVCCRTRLGQVGARGAAERDDPLSGLTEQERTLLGLLSEGLTNRQIAARMFLAEKTVKNYVSRLLAKLGMERRTQAAVFASRLSQWSGQPGQPGVPTERPAQS